jgi:hypothetical protein
MRPATRAARLRPAGGKWMPLAGDSDSRASGRPAESDSDPGLGARGGAAARRKSSARLLPPEPEPGPGPATPRLAAKPASPGRGRRLAVPWAGCRCAAAGGRASGWPRPGPGWLRPGPQGRTGCFPGTVTWRATRMCEQRVSSESPRRRLPHGRPRTPLRRRRAGKQSRRRRQGPVRPGPSESAGDQVGRRRKMRGGASRPTPQLIPALQVGRM